MVVFFIIERQHLEGMGMDLCLGSNLIIALSQIFLFHHHRSRDLIYVHVLEGLMVILRAFNGAEHTTSITKNGLISQKNSCTYLISFYL